MTARVTHIDTALRATSFVLVASIGAIRILRPVHCVGGADQPRRHCCAIGSIAVAYETAIAIPFYECASYGP